MSAPKSSINLLTAEIRPQGQWDRIYAWTANTAKYIIILTEIVVVGAIAFRFVIDGRIAKLEEQIEMSKQLVDYLKPEETKIRQLLASMNSIKQMEQSRYSLASYYQQIEALVPPSVTVQSMTIDIANSSIVGQVTSYDTLLQLENNLKNATELLSDVTMSTNQAQGGAINFTASFNMKFGGQ